MVDGLSRALWPLGARAARGAARRTGTRCECVDAAAGDRARALRSNPALRSSAVRRGKAGARAPDRARRASAQGRPHRGYTRYHYPTLVTPIRRAGEFPPLDRDITIWVPPSTCRCMPAASSLPENRWPLTPLPHEASRESLRAVGQDLIFNVASTYTKALHLRDLQRASASRIRTLEAEEKNTTLRMGEGRHRATGLMRLQTQLSQSRHDVLSIAQAEQDALSLLAALLGEHGSLPPLADTVPFNAALPASREDAIAAALAQHPELAQAQALGLAAADRLEIARGDLRPQLSLVGRLQQTAGGDLHAYDSSQIGVQMALPLFDGAVRKHRVDQAVLSPSAAGSPSRRCNPLRAEAQQARARWRSASRRAVALQAEREARSAAHRNARYDTGEARSPIAERLVLRCGGAPVSRLQAEYDGAVTSAGCARPAVFPQPSIQQAPWRGGAPSQGAERP